MAPDEDWRQRLTTSYTYFAKNDRVAPDITAVAPVYNTPALHLDECVRSLPQQTVRPREILAPVYSWFTEGFNTADLKDAKALLGELA
jgi:hypothetical protein